MTAVPVWMAELEDEDLAFIKKFILASGSLKEVASVYGVSYPTVRLRLDRLIQKIQLTETAEADPYVSLVKRLAVDDKLDFDTAKILITEYRKTKEASDGLFRQMTRSATAHRILAAGSSSPGHHVSLRARNTSSKMTAMAITANFTVSPASR